MIFVRVFRSRGLRARVSIGSALVFAPYRESAPDSWSIGSLACLFRLFLVLARDQWSRDAFVLLAICVPDPVARCAVYSFRLSSHDPPNPVRGAWPIIDVFVLGFVYLLFFSTSLVFSLYLLHYLLSSLHSWFSLFVCFGSVTPPVSTHFVDRGRVCRRYFRVTTCHSSSSPLPDHSSASI